jgi:site-specific DNA recombinase
MTGRRTRNWGQTVLEYTCYKNNPGVQPGCGRHIRAGDIEESVWQRILDWLRNPEALANQLRPTTDTTLAEEEIARQEKDLQKVRNSQKNVLTVLERDLLPADDVLDSLNRLKRREAALLRSIEELRQSLRAAGYQNFDRETAVGAARRWLIRAESDLPTEERQEIVRQFITGITVGHDTLTVKARMPALERASEPVAERVWAVPMAGR